MTAPSASPQATRPHLQSFEELSSIRLNVGGGNAARQLAQSEYTGCSKTSSVPMSLTLIRVSVWTALSDCKTREMGRLTRYMSGEIFPPMLRGLAP